MDKRFWIEEFERQSSIALKLAWRNITRDRIRLCIAVVGVGFAVLLMTVQLGLLVGFATTASSLIDNAHADFWVVPRGAKDVDQAGQLPERQKYLAVGVPGVEAVQSLVVHFADWQRPDGGTESVIVVGIDLEEPALKPWQFSLGSTENLRLADGIVIDELYAQKLGVETAGQTVEIMKRRAKVVGFTSQIRTFTQSPYVFTSLANAKRLIGMPEDRTSYILVRAKPDADFAKVQAGLRAAVPSADVWSASGFSWQTKQYWLVTTGSGAALLLATVLGLVVGIVIVSQTLYSATVERLEEYATIRAIGADNRYVQTIVLQQSLLSGAIGYGLGTAAAFCFAWLSRGSSAAMSLSPPLILLLAAITAAMSAGASLISIRKVLSIDPASVFR